MATVDEIIGRVTATADRTAREGKDYLREAAAAARSAFTLNPVVVADPGSPSEPDFDYSLADFTGVFTGPIFNVNKPNYESALGIGSVAYPADISLDIGGLFKQKAPDLSIDQFDKKAPDLDIDGVANDLKAVDKPVFNEIEEPVLSAIDISDVPRVNVPGFAQSVQLKEVGDPDDLCAKFEEKYAALLPAMKDHIDGVVNGWMREYAPNLNANLAAVEVKINQGLATGQALSDEFEQALYTRARSRVEGESDRVLNELTEGVSKRGFSLPPAVLNAGRVQIHQATADNIAQQSTEIAIERAKMEIQHLQYVMQLSQSISQMMINAALQYAQTQVQVNAQAIDTARQCAAFLAQHYELLLANARLNIDVLNAEVKIFETELQSALAVFEGYRLELEAAKLKVDVDLAQVTLYTKRLDAQMTEVNKYVAILDGIMKRGELEKLKVEIFGEQVKAYIAGVSAVEAENDLYLAALKGDEAKLKGELAKVDIYEQEVNIANSKQQLKFEKIKSISAINTDKREQYLAFIRKYLAELNAEESRFGSEVAIHKLELADIETELRVKREVYGAEFDAIVSRANIAALQAEADMNSRNTAAELFIKRSDLISKTSVSVGTIYSNMAAALYSAQNTMVSQNESL